MRRRCWGSEGANIWKLCVCLREAERSTVGLFFFLKFFLNIYLFLKDRVRQSVSGGGAEREGDTESETDSRLQAVSTEPDAGLSPMNLEIMT